MKLNCNQIADAVVAIETLMEDKLPFKISLSFAKNLKNLRTAQEFFFEQERKFAENYLIFKEDGSLEQTAPGVYKIQDGKVKECVEARKALDTFLEDVDIRLVKAEDLESISFSPKTLAAIEFMIDETEENGELEFGNS